MRSVPGNERAVSALKGHTLDALNAHSSCSAFWICRFLLHESFLVESSQTCLSALWSVVLASRIPILGEWPRLLDRRLQSGFGFDAHRGSGFDAHGGAGISLLHGCP